MKMNKETWNATINFGGVVAHSIDPYDLVLDEDEEMTEEAELELSDGRDPSEVE